jgi:soluble lytic murein transglycosylase-like protein
MRPILAFALLLLAMSSAAPEPEYSHLLRGLLQTDQEGSPGPLVEIESATARSDRLPMLIPASAEVTDDPALQSLEPATPMPLPPETNLDPDANAPAAPNPAANNPPAPASNDNPPPPQVSLPDLCNALLTAAEDNDLPVAFFANLIWQESRLRDNAVSPKGALGIAQFMPQVAARNGLQNPLDPLQALPASARLLRTLRDQFRNLGYVAAAYNAGAGRVLDWLEHGRTLPRETRGYVLNVTGHSAEEWRKMPVDDASLHFVRRLPCRDLPAFADLERAQQEAQAAQDAARRAQAEQQRQAQAEQKAAQQKKEPPQAEAAARVERKHVVVREDLAERDYIVPHERVAERERVAGHERVAERERLAERGHGRNALLHRASFRVAERERRHPEHEAKQRFRRAAHEGHRRV